MNSWFDPGQKGEYCILGHMFKTHDELQERHFVKTEMLLYHIRARKKFVIPDKLKWILDPCVPEDMSRKWFGWLEWTIIRTASHRNGFIVLNIYACWADTAFLNIWIPPASPTATWKHRCAFFSVGVLWFLLVLAIKKFLQFSNMLWCTVVFC